MIKQWRVVTKDIEDLKTSDNNPREIDPKNMQGLWNSLRRFGYVDLIVWNKRTGYVVGGHKRLQLAIQAGAKKVSVVEVDMSEEDELAASLTLDNPNVQGEFDETAFDLVSKIESENLEAFKDLNFDDLRKDLSKNMPKNKSDESDTRCPCCKHRWKVSAEDVVLMTPEQQREREFNP